MKNLFTILLLTLIPGYLLSQAPGCPNVTANVGAPITCSNPCTNLSATVFQTGETTNYNVTSIPYAPPFPFTGGTSLFVGQDDIFGNTINLGFNFCFYGTSYNQCVIGANGLISFDLINSGAFCDWSFNAGIPSGATTPPYHNSINGAYVDIDPSVNSGGDINYTVLGTAPCRTFVVSFHDIAMFSCNSQLVTQQIVLYETTNVIEVYIENLQTCSGWNSGNAVIGIQDATGANGVTPPGRNTGAWSTTNEAWRFTPSGAPNYTFTWYDPGMNPISNNLVHNICPTASGNYTAEVVYTNCDGTIITETDIVNVNVTGNIPSVDAGQDDTTCTDVNNNIIPVNLGGTPTASGGQAPYTYTWTPGTGLSTTTGANPTASPNTTTTYTLTVQDNNGCTVYDTVTVYVNNLNPPTMASTPETCAGDNDGTAIATPTNGTPGYSYNWTPSGQTTNPATNLTPGNYTVTVTDANGCAATNTVNVAAGPSCTSCYMDSLTVALTNCYSVPTLGYDVNGNIYFNNAPASGTLTITSCQGGTQVFNAPFVSPIAFSFTNLPQNGSNCTFTAVFSADTNCTDSITLQAPTPISIPAVVTDLTCFGSGNGQVIVAPQGGLPNYNYTWSVGGIGNNPIAGNLSAGQITLTVTDANGCTLDSTYTVSEPAQITFNTDLMNSNCFMPDGWAAIYNVNGGTPGYTYDWGAGPTLNDTLTNLVPGVYTVTIADAQGCDTTVSITVGNNAAFTASITGFNHVSCNGLNDGDATADGSDPLATYTFSWNTIPAQNTQTATGLAAGTYVATVTDVNTGCIDTVSVTITEPPLLTVNAGNDVTICTGGNTNLNAVGAGGTPGYTYSWNNGLGAGQSHNVSPAVQTIYTVTVTDASGCTATDDITVSIHPPLLVTTSPDDSICPGGQANISAQATAGSGNGGPYSYSWDNGLGNGQSHNVSPATTTTYTVTLSDGCSPNVTATVTIYVNPLPAVDFLADTFGICETPLQPFTFWNTTPTPTSSATWNFGDGSAGAGDTTSHTYGSPGSYDITLTVTDATTGCTNSLTKTNYVSVYANPVADFTMNPNPATMFNPTINFNDQSYTNIVSWWWNIGGLDTSNLQNPSYTFPEDTGNYLVTLVVVDANGCTNTITQTAIVQGEFGVYVPNAFTPDADGMNEGFFPSGFGISDYDYSFFIFDRWGENIFESHKKFEPWDGTYKGKLVQNGVYVWKLEFRDINGKIHTKVGHVNVIR